MINDSCARKFIKTLLWKEKYKKQTSYLVWPKKEVSTVTCEEKHFNVNVPKMYLTNPQEGNFGLQFRLKL